MLKKLGEPVKKKSVENSTLGSESWDPDSVANVLKYNYLFSFSLMNFLSLDHFLFLATTCLGGVLPSSS